MIQKSSPFNTTSNYDSHVHFFGVGLPAVDWIIKSDDLCPPPELLESQTLIRGFGFPLNCVSDDIESLMNTYKDHDFCLSLKDGHGSLVSKTLAKSLGFTPQSQGHLETPSSYTLFEKERDEFIKLLPKRSVKDLKKMAIFAQKYFLDKGVTRVRHLTATWDQWLALKSLQEEGLLKIEIEAFFSEFLNQSFEEATQALKRAFTTPIEGVTPCGLKVFLDGSIGSNTAAMSSQTSPGFRLTDKEFEKRLAVAFKELKTDLAVHTIGDLSLEKAVLLFKKYIGQEGLKSFLHLEHAPVFTKETIDCLREHHLNCRFHFQPSHWLSDVKWYEKNKELLKPHQIYPFEFLKNNNYEFFMGSDAPVEPSSYEETQKGLEAIEKTRLS